MALAMHVHEQVGQPRAGQAAGTAPRSRHVAPSAAVSVTSVGVTSGVNGPCRSAKPSIQRLEAIGPDGDDARRGQLVMSLRSKRNQAKARNTAPYVRHRPVPRAMSSQLIGLLSTSVHA